MLLCGCSDVDDCVLAHNRTVTRSNTNVLDIVNIIGAVNMPNYDVEQLNDYYLLLYY